ncbi:Putative ribonuclease H-like superfamily, exonuclease, RNase T/DNA polymerase III [Colletotrichum destructivum]|uniref:RNA exonuclease 4 n=1 Tax=Colletotrichum destructivum TaxID=34406 RepID=A0AAX4IAU6_9PEZI|nr:Putative ribonuclease H-like superfamily, exonuclease, RNase T/DNA polymerase III [Colletotrichum destructivum]
MAPELSSNWKKLQAQLKAASPSSSIASGPIKRKADISDQRLSKKPKLKSDNKSVPVKIIQKNDKAKKEHMGVTQSSKVEVEPKVGSSPSLALWAEENDISPEALAEAYGLGVKNNSMLTLEKDKINAGLTEGLDVGKYVAIDCEMVGVGQGGHESVLARVSIVDFHGRQVYDSYVRPQERVTDWRSAVSGIHPKHMRFARDFDEVQTDVAKLLKDRIVVGHDIKHDLDVLKLSHPGKDVRDTSSYPAFRQYGNGRKPALRRLAEEILGVTIQGGAHSSIEDARVTMLLFRKHKSGFDVDHANRFPGSAGASAKSKPKSKKTKKKK